MTQDSYQEPQQEMNHGERVHAGHPVPDEVRDYWRSSQEEDLAAWARHHKLTEQGRPTEEERRSIIELYEPAARNLGVDVEKLRERRHAIRERNIALSKETLEEEEAARAAKPDERVPLYLETPPPEREDITFWWARDSWTHVGEFRVFPRPDGVHYFGGITHHSGNLRNAHFEYRSFFALDAGRIPPTPTGRYLSAPHMELFGRIDGRDGDCDWVSGDIWSKCWMHRRQKLTQPTFGGVKVLGERLEVQNLFFLECVDRHASFFMPGRQNWPALVFNSGEALPNATIWAELHLFFHIQLEGTASIQLNPEVHVRGFQWPLLTG
jgi:hypothetical protein